MNIIKKLLSLKNESRLFSLLSLKSFDYTILFLVICCVVKPDATIKGAVKAISQIEAEVVLIGNEEIINQKVKEFYGKEPEEISDRLIVKNATDYSINQ